MSIFWDKKIGNFSHYSKNIERPYLKNSKLKKPENRFFIRFSTFCIFHENMVISEGEGLHSIIGAGAGVYNINPILQTLYQLFYFVITYKSYLYVHQHEIFCMCFNYILELVHTWWRALTFIYLFCAGKNKFRKQKMLFMLIFSF